MAIEQRGLRIGGSTVATLGALVALMVPSAAGAATVTVRPDPDTAWEGAGESAYDEVHYVAAPGERNRLLVTYAADARSVVVSDAGAPVTASGSCVALDAHSARCVARPGARVEWLQLTRVELGDLDDELATSRPGPAPIGGVVADGGPGDDRLDGGAGSDRLDGGGGRDTLLGGAGLDVLTDGDRDGAPGEAAPGADVLDGGPDVDHVSYAQRTVSVAVSLADPGADGAAGEGDALSGFEDVTGGAGGDRLIGDDGVNVLRGGGGADVLAGRGGRHPGGFGDRLDGGKGRDRLSGGDGPDDLTGGGGRDAIRCGSRRDVVRDPRGGELLPRDCETLSYAFGVEDEDTLTFAAYPRRTTRTGAVFTLRCPSFESRDGEFSPCRGLLTLREADERRRLLGRARFSDAGRRASFPVRVTLTDLGRRRAERPTGVPTTAFLRGEDVPAVSWSFLLSTRW